MRTLLLASTAALLLAGTAGADGMDQAGTWYVGGSIGANWASSIDPGTFFGNSLDTEFETGWALTGNVGYRWPATNFRTELELAYRQNDVASIFQSPVLIANASGDVSQFSIMANALYDFPIADQWSLTLGAGIGAAQSDVSATGLPGSQVLLADSDDGWSFAYQGIAGIAYAVSNQTSVYVEYRYLANSGHDIVTFPPPNVPRAAEIDTDSQTISVGIRLSL